MDRFRYDQFVVSQNHTSFMTLFRATARVLGTVADGVMSIVAIHAETSN